jgi:hypothetical protein
MGWDVEKLVNNLKKLGRTGLRKEIKALLSAIIGISLPRDIKIKIIQLCKSSKV